MALSSLLSPPTHVSSNSTHSIPKLYHFSHSTSFSFQNTPSFISFPTNTCPQNQKWRTNVSFFPSFFNKTLDPTPIKQELLEAIAPLDRGAEATPEDQEIIDQVCLITTPSILIYMTHFTSKFKLYQVWPIFWDVIFFKYIDTRRNATYTPSVLNFFGTNVQYWLIFHENLVINTFLK